MSACAPDSLRIAISSVIALRPRTQLPRRSVACGASQSWLTWAPASDNPSAQWASLSRPATSVDVVVQEHRPHPQREIGLVEREVEQHVERRHAALARAR